MNKEQLYQIIRAPHVSEKSTRVGGQGNQYVFRVAKSASKSVAGVACCRAAMGWTLATWH